LIESCWNPILIERPSFAEIQDVLDPLD